MSATIHSLAPELLDHILDLVRGPGAAWIFSGLPPANSDVLAAALVCRDWAATVQRVLWRDARMTLDVENPLCRGGKPKVPVRHLWIHYRGGGSIESMFELAVVNQAATSWTGDVLRKTPQLQSLCVTTEQVEAGPFWGFLHSPSLAGVANLVESSNPLPFRLIHLGLTLYSALDCSRLLNALFTASVDSLVSLRLTIDCEANDHDYEVLKTNLALVAPNLERLDLQFLLVSDGPPSMPLPLVSTYVDIAVFKSLKHLGILSGIKKDEDLPGLCLDRLPLPATLVHLTVGICNPRQADQITSTLPLPALAQLERIDLANLDRGTLAAEAKGVELMEECERRGIRLVFREHLL